MSESLVDFHIHVLPGVDDGARDLSESNQMLKMLLRQGVDTVCLTPHFYPYKETITSFLERRERAFTALKPSGKKLGMNFALASETFLNNYLFHSEDILALCMQDSAGHNYLLTELPFDSSFSERTLNRISRLIDTYNVCPVLAHIERYSKLINNRSLINRLIDMGCLMQINLNSLQEGFLRKKKLLWYLHDNLIHVVGTDAHNMGKRPPNYQAGIKIIKKSLGNKVIQQITHNAHQIVSGCLQQEAEK